MFCRGKVKKNGVNSSGLFIQNVNFTIYFLAPNFYTFSVRYIDHYAINISAGLSLFMVWIFQLGYCADGNTEATLK